MLCGGVQVNVGVSVDDTALVAGLTAALNARVGHHHTSYEIISVSTQVVAGTNKFFHLRGQPGNHDYTVTVHIPLPHTGLAAEISELSCGFNAHAQGHSSHEHHEGHHHHSGECTH